jgi:hypothetical protein
VSDQPTEPSTDWEGEPCGTFGCVWGRPDEGGVSGFCNHLRGMTLVSRRIIAKLGSALREEREALQAEREETKRLRAAVEALLARGGDS